MRGESPIDPHAQSGQASIARAILVKCDIDLATVYAHAGRAEEGELASRCEEWLDEQRRARRIQRSRSLLNGGVDADEPADAKRRAVLRALRALARPRDIYHLQSRVDYSHHSRFTPGEKSAHLELQPRHVQCSNHGC